MHVVEVRFTKWGGHPHWQFEATRLGEDRHGVWLGALAGTRVRRPDADFRSPLDFAVLLPRDGAFVASFYAHLDGQGPRHRPDASVEVYVDISTVPQWTGRTVSMVDLDLDVVRGRSGRVWVDDEDEFADHRVRLGYPDEVVRLASTSCDAVREAVASRQPPYDGVVAPRWLSRLPTSSGSVRSPGPAGSSGPAGSRGSSGPSGHPTTA